MYLYVGYNYEKVKNIILGTMLHQSVEFKDTIAKGDINATTKEDEVVTQKRNSNIKGVGQSIQNQSKNKENLSIA